MGLTIARGWSTVATGGGTRAWRRRVDDRTKVVRGSHGHGEGIAAEVYEEKLGPFILHGRSRRPKEGKIWI